jgi:predicted glycogen debranching enzyme
LIRIEKPKLEEVGKEWVLANGLGGYSSSTVLGINTRKYHGLLVATTNPPWGRKLLLSKLEEELEVGGEIYPLSSNFYPGVVHPQGHLYLSEFRLFPFPTFVYTFPRAKVEKEIIVPHGLNAVMVKYRVLGNGESRLRIFPLLNCRDIHSLTARGEVAFGEEQVRGGVKVLVPERGAEIYLGSDLARYIPSNLSESDRWYLNMEYPEERERGYPFREDHYCPGHFEFRGRETSFHLVVAGGWKGEAAWQFLLQNPLLVLQREEKRQLEVTSARKELFPLLLAADSFFAETPNGTFVLAGYHWFSTWLRDALISLPGLALVTGRYLLAREVLLTAAGMERAGMLPNFVEDGRVDFGAADSSLWLFYALHKYLSYTDDVSILQVMIPVLRRIMLACVQGTAAARMGKDGLLSVPPGYTWMDARIGGAPVTPRGGKPVEINALWYNSLRLMEVLGERVAGAPSPEEVRENFLRQFWGEGKGHLCDTVCGEYKDWSLRPNQIFALSLPFPLIAERDRASRILNVLWNKLLTPVGLRSLSPDDPQYRGRYLGDVFSRDATYHQGTVWGWLIGPFVTALIRFGWERETGRRLLEPLMTKHLGEAGLGTISEIFDGDPPHPPRGCVSQAWSVAEVLRSYVEDVLGIKPPYEKKYVS